MRGILIKCTLFLLCAALLFLLAGCGEIKNAENMVDAGNYADAVAMLNTVKSNDKSDALYRRIQREIATKVNHLLDEDKFDEAFQTLDGLSALTNYETLQQRIETAITNKHHKLLVAQKIDDAKALADQYADLGLSFVTGLKASFTAVDCRSGGYVGAKDFTVAYTRSDGKETELDTDAYEIISGGDHYLSGKEQTFVLKDNEYGLEASVTVKVPAYRYFSGKTRTAFANAFFSDMKGLGLKKYSMELSRNDNGIVKQASFRDSRGRYCYFMYFSNGGDDKNDAFSGVSIENNNVAGYSASDMAMFRMVLVRQTVPKGESVPTIIKEMELKPDGSGGSYGSCKTSTVEYSNYTLYEDFLGRSYLSGSVDANCIQDTVSEK